MGLPEFVVAGEEIAAIRPEGGVKAKTRVYAEMSFSALSEEVGLAIVGELRNKGVEGGEEHWGGRIYKVVYKIIIGISICHCWTQDEFTFNGRESVPLRLSNPICAGKRFQHQFKLKELLKTSNKTMELPSQYMTLTQLNFL